MPTERAPGSHCRAWQWWTGVVVSLARRVSQLRRQPAATPPTPCWFACLLVSFHRPCRHSSISTGFPRVDAHPERGRATASWSRVGSATTMYCRLSGSERALVGKEKLASRNATHPGSSGRARYICFGVHSLVRTRPRLLLSPSCPSFSCWGVVCVCVGGWCCYCSAVGGGAASARSRHLFRNKL